MPEAQSVPYSYDGATRTGERNVNWKKNATSENVASNIFHPDKRAPSFIIKQVYICVIRYRFSVADTTVPFAIYFIETNVLSNA